MARLGDICSINMGQSPDSSTYNEERIGLPFFQGNADFGTLHPSVRIWCSTPVKIAKQNDILISVRAPIGALNIADMECCIGRGLAALTVNPAICEQKYVWYGLESKVEELISKGTGSTFKAISKSILLDTELPIPCLTEQVHIAAVLDKVSELIDLRKQQLAKLDELVKARFVEMFGDPVHPACSKLLGEAAILERGRFSLRPRNDPRYYGGEYPFIQTGDIANCGHRLSEYRQTLNEKGIHVSKKFDAGTIAIAIVGATIGATAILEIDVYAPDSVIGISVDKKQYNNVFMEVLLRFWQPELQRIAPESARANINLAILQGLPIIDVELRKQVQFATFVEQTDKSKLTIQQGLDKLEILKKSLMQEYFG